MTATVTVTVFAFTMFSGTVLTVTVFSGTALSAVSLGPTDVDPDTVRDAACSLTAADDVCNPATPPPTSPPDVDPSDLEPLSADVAAGGSAAGAVLVWILVALLALALGWLVYVWWRDRTARSRGTSEEGDDTTDEEGDGVGADEDDALAARMVDHARPPDGWRTAAADLRASGRYRDAIRCEYRALVGDLARRGVVDEIPGRTSGEERRQVAQLSSAASPAFHRAADLFDVAWFTHAEVTAADDAAFRAAATEVLDASTDQARTPT